MDFQDKGSAIEAEEVIKAWLSKVENHPGSYPSVSQASSSHEAFSRAAETGDQRDLLSGVDWEGGSAAETTKTILDALMTTEIPQAYCHVSGKARSYDPHVAMETRHKQVKERRAHRDKQRRQQLESQLLLEQAQREAREMVLKEEKEAKKKTVMEEKLINQQISLIRGQIRQQRKATNQLAAAQRKAIEDEIKKKKKGGRDGDKGKDGIKELEQKGVADILLASPTVVMAEKVVEEERKRQLARSELVRQLEEAETLELKERMRLLRGFFSAWYEEVVTRRSKVRKATAVRDWKLMARVWGAWRKWVGRRRNRREEAAVARELQRNKRLYEVATQHYDSSLLLRVLRGWYRVIRIARAQRREQEEEEDRKRKMQSLLQAARVKAEGNLRPAPPSHPLSSTPLPPPIPATGQHQHPAELFRHSSSPSPPAMYMTTPTRAGGPVPRKPPVPKFPSLRPEPSVYRMAQQEMEELHLEVQEKAMRGRGHPALLGSGSNNPDGKKDMVPKLVLHEAWGQVSGPGPVPVPGSNPGSDAEAGPRSTGISTSDLRPLRRLTPIVRPKPKPITKPAPMTGMESRAAAAAERRLARERRKEEQLREKAERMAREEEEKQKAEQLARETALRQRREERRLAKLREEEKQKRLRLQEELNKMARKHYHTFLLHRRGVAPWKKFVDLCQANVRKADELSEEHVKKRTLARWQSVWARAVEEKEKTADKLHCRLLVQRMWRLWKSSVVLSRQLEEFACSMHPHLLVKACFLGWKRVTKEEENDYWEMCAQARRFRQRCLLSQVLREWSKYIPVAKERRKREKWKAHLRRKVVQWLPDFVGKTYEDSDDEDI